MNTSPCFDDVIHQPTRFRIYAALAASVEMEFSLLREVVDVSDSLLSKQIKVLADADYARIRKRRQPVGRPRTWVSLTDAGRSAYDAHVAALRAIVVHGL